MITDSVPLMRQLARMANMPEAGIRRMILVLDFEDTPKLYVETLFRGQEEELVEVRLDPPKPLIVDTTTFLNERFRTCVQLKLPDCRVCGESDGSHRDGCSVTP